MTEYSFSNAQQEAQELLDSLDLGLDFHHLCHPMV
jgi:hypothetical protein